ncbi:MAG: DUF2269 domain-containing protein [Ramlibacter sp.]|nr:DUF2269 domain-containing protein [Ramlibacter sp.]
MTYLALKWLHLLGASILFGTGMGIAFFAWFAYRMAMREGNLRLLQGVLRLTVVADTVFTAAAAAVQPVTGLALWWLQRGPWDSRWLWWVFALYVFVGACWLPVVVLQIRLRNEAVQASSIGALSSRFHSRFRMWFILGWPAFAGVLALFGLMLARPYFI